MSQMSDYLENLLINLTLRGATLTSAITPYVGLYRSNPQDGNVGEEVSGNGYVRKSVAFTVPSDGSSSNVHSIEFPVATGSWGTVAYVGILDAESAGHLLYHGQVGTPKSVGAGDQVRIPSGNLTVTLQ